jgi:DASS family divalent anion:Na+ symporter
MMPFALLIAFATGYGALLTHYGGAVGPVLFGTGYVNQIDWWRIGAVVVGVNLLVYFVIGLPYWKILGMW